MVAAALALGLQACGGGASGTATASRLQAVATVTSADPIAGEPVLLDGSASVLPPNGSVSFSWTVRAPDGSTVALSDAATPRPYFTPTVAGRYGVDLSVTATGDNGASATSPAAHLDVTVAAATPPTLAEVRTRIRSLAASAAASAPLPPDGSSPALITVPTGDGSAIAGSRLLPWTRPEFVYAGDVLAAGSVYPDYLFGANRAVDYGSAGRAGNYLTVDFIADASAFEVLQKGRGDASRLFVIVDGRLASENATVMPADGDLHLVLVSFSSKARRHVRLLMSNPFFGGVRVGPGDTIERPAAGTRLRTMFLGDSITESAAGQEARGSYAVLAAERLGWSEAWISGVGSTGYLAAPGGKKTLRGRLATDVIAYAPSVLVIAAGVSDTAFTDEQIQAEAAALFDQVEAGLPQTLVFVTGPLATTTRARAGINAAIKAAVGTRANFVWVPNVDEAWLNDANAAQYLSRDATTPTPAGIDYLADRLAAFVRQAVP